MPNIGAPELIIILVIALLILGPGKLPEVGASIGKSIREFRKASADVTDAVRIDATPAPAGPASVTQASAPAQTATPASVPVAAAAAPTAEPQPNVLQTTAEPNVLKPPETVADPAPSDVAPTSNG
jgi:TatA/E family protein of Tat protein translocase